MADVAYTTIDGDVLDDIIFRYYGKGVSVLQFILEANPGLAEKGAVYRSGVTIVLPDLPMSVTASSTILPWS